MNPNDDDHDDDVPAELQELLVDIATGRTAVEDPRCLAAAHTDPAFRDRVRGALDVVARLRAYRAAEAAAIAAPPSPLDRVATTAAREAFGRAAAPAATSSRRGRPMWWLGLAAAILLGILVFHYASPRDDAGGRPGDDPVMLGGEIGVAIDVARRQLRFDPPPGVGQGYRVEFGRGETVVHTVHDIHGATLPLADLRAYLPIEWLRVSSIENGELGPGSGRVVLPPDLWR